MCYFCGELFIVWCKILDPVVAVLFVCVLSVFSSVALDYVCLALGLEPGRLGCTRKGDKTASIYNGRYVSTHNGNA